MTRFAYSLLRFVPNPATGEFVNLGAVVGSEATGEWSLRHVQNDQRARALAGNVPVSVFYDFYGRLADEVDRHDYASLFEDDAIELGLLDEAWLTDWASRAQNVVQFSRPQPLVATDAESALDLIFEHMVDDPARTRYRFMTRRAVFGQMRSAYWGAGLRHSLSERCVVKSNDYQAMCDFAVGDGQVLQLAHSYSFGIASQTTLANAVKAWGWTMAELRRHGGVVTTQTGRTMEIDSKVDIEVLYALPEDSPSPVAFVEAQRVFKEIDVTAVSFGDASKVADRARTLVPSVARRLTDEQ